MAPRPEYAVRARHSDRACVMTLTQSPHLLAFRVLERRHSVTEHNSASCWCCAQVRVANVVELIYKNGQAGVTKAAVTLIFDNSDPKLSPIGYEQHKEITIQREV